MKIALIAPPVFDFYFTPHRMEPLGLLYIREALERAGHTVSLYDSTLSGKVKHIARPQEFAYLDRFYEEDISPFSLHCGYKRLGDSFSKITAFVSSGGFDLVGISSLFSPYHPDVEALAAEIKKCSSVPLVIGGTAVNAQKKLIAKSSNADLLLCGCGSVSFPELAEALEGKRPLSEVRGLIYRKGGEICFNEPSFEPAWSGDLIPRRENLRFFRKKRIAKTVFSSGCRNRCAFCSIHRDNRLAYRDIAHIREELEYLLSIGAEIVDIEDDDIFSSEKYTSELLDMLEEMHGKGLSFTALNGLTAKNIVPFAGKMEKAGFIKLDLSLVSASAEIAKELGRPHGLNDIEKIRELTGGRIETEVFLIPGLPGASLQGTCETLVHLHKMGVKCGLSPLYLVPGIPMFEKMGIPENVKFCRGSALYPFDDEKRADIAALLKISRFLNYLLGAEENAETEMFRSRFFDSLSRNRWQRLDKNGEWHDSFGFSEKFDAVM